MVSQEDGRVIDMMMKIESENSSYHPPLKLKKKKTQTNYSTSKCKKSQIVVIFQPL